MERQANQYQAGGEATTTTGVAPGDAGWTPERATIVGGLLIGAALARENRRISAT